jgi:hypothetical protein
MKAMCLTGETVSSTCHLTGMNHDGQSLNSHQTSVYGFKMNSMRQSVLKDAQVRTIDASSVFTDLVEIKRLDLATCTLSDVAQFKSVFRLKATRDAMLTGFGVSFETHFDHGSLQKKVCADFYLFSHLCVIRFSWRVNCHTRFPFQRIHSTREPTGNKRTFSWTSRSESTRTRRSKAKYAAAKMLTTHAATLFSSTSTTRPIASTSNSLRPFSSCFDTK